MKACAVSFDAVDPEFWTRAPRTDCSFLHFTTPRALILPATTLIILPSLTIVVNTEQTSSPTRVLPD